MSERPRLKFCTASPDNAPLMDGFVFAPPDRSILIQPFDVTRFASIPNWLCLAPFSVPGPPQRERPDTPVPSARCCCLLRSQAHPVLVIRPASAIRHLASAIRHLPLATLPAAPAGHASSSFRVCRSHSAPSGPPDAAWAKLVACPLPASPALQCRGLDDLELKL